VGVFPILSAIERSKDLHPQDPRRARILRGLAAAYRAQGRDTQAEEVLKRARAITAPPTSAVAGDVVVVISLERALAVPPTALAQGTLWVTYTLATVRAVAVNPNITFSTPVDQGNAQAYTTKVATDCRGMFPLGTAVLQQQGFNVELATEGVRYRTVVVVTLRRMELS
jgi:hypothetical protein